MVRGVIRVMGMVNQLGKFSSLLSEVSTPIRELLSKRNHFVWRKAQQGVFEKIKILLTSSEILALYDPNKEIIVAADSSRNALGVAICQVQENGHKKPMAYASRALTTTERVGRKTLRNWLN